MLSVSRLVPAVEGLANYGNPFQIALRRLFTHGGEMTIVDRKTGVSVAAMRRSYHIFGETWYQHDYDVVGCPMRRGDVVVDVGANQGFFTCYAACQGAQVFAFEPNPKAFGFLRRNIMSNGFADRVTAECAAIADFEGETDLFCSSYMDGGTDPINQQRGESIVSIVGEQSRVPVKVTRLASRIPADINIRLLKLDCEGAELAILNDLKNSDRIDSMAIEYHDAAYKTEALIETILGLGTHQVYALRGHIVHAIRTDILLEYARNLH
jgi:FkbM family methyltransferase